MTGALKGALLFVGAYLSALVAAGLVSGAILVVLSPRSCSALGRALLVLWAAIAAVFLFSLLIVALASGRLALGRGGRVATVAAYALALLATYLVVAFGLMVAFNC